MNPSHLFPAIDKVGQNGIFSIGKVTSLGEGKTDLAVI